MTDTNRATRFHEGQQVESTTNAQGLTKGERYTVVEVHERSYGFFGNLVTYGLRGGGENNLTLYVGNGHLLLTEVE